MAKACSSFKTGGKNFYEIVIFLLPVYRLMHALALKKVHFLKSHFLPPIQKRYFLIYRHHRRRDRACPTTG